MPEAALWISEMLHQQMQRSAHEAHQTVALYLPRCTGDSCTQRLILYLFAEIQGILLPAADFAIDAMPRVCA